jgi:TonB family protein
MLVAKREKFGKFVLLEEVDVSGLGHEYRAAKLSSTGLEKIVSVVRLKPNLSANADAAKSLMDQVKFAAQLQNPNIVKIFGIGKVDTLYYISYESLEGKSLKAIFNRCRQEGFPFSVDHALLIMSKVCSALEYAHGRKNDSGARYYHGFLTPAAVVVSYEGEVRVRNFGYWASRIRESGAVAEEESLYLSPEQAAGGAGDSRSDVFAVGALLFETLTGQPLFQGGRTDDIAGRLSKARLQNPTTDDDALPKPISDILHRALARDPAARYAEVQEMRKAVDTLLFSGDFTPTTFNLAFFMHSLFREDIEREAKVLKEEKEASYFEYLTETTPPTGKVVPPPQQAPPPIPELSPRPTPAPPPPPPVQAYHPDPVRHEPPPPPPRETSRPAPPPLVEPPAAPVSSHEAAAGFTFHKGEGSGKKIPLILGGVAALVVIAVAAFLLLRGRQGSSTTAVPATTTLSPQAQDALAKVRELQERLAALEAEKKAAEDKAAEDARKKLEAQAAARGTTADPAAVQRAQEEAAKKARQEQERKAAEERKRLEDEKKAEEARLADERRKQDEEAARLAALAATATTTLPTPPPTTATTQPAIRPGMLVNLSDPGVIAPVVVSQPPLQYPPIAQRQRLEGTVELNVLVDERGSVVDAQVVQGAGGKAGLNEAAVDNVRKRKYRPATKDGVPVKVWSPVRVVFKLPS